MIPFLNSYPREMKKHMHAKTYTWMCTASLFIITKKWKQPTYTQREAGRKCVYMSMQMGQNINNKCIWIWVVSMWVISILYLNFSKKWIPTEHFLHIKHCTRYWAPAFKDIRLALVGCPGSPSPQCEFPEGSKHWVTKTGGGGGRAATEHSGLLQ